MRTGAVLYLARRELTAVEKWHCVEGDRVEQWDRAGMGGGRGGDVTTVDLFRLTEESF